MRLVNFYVCVVAIHLAPVTQPSPVTSVPPALLVSEFIKYHEPARYNQETLRWHRRERRHTRNLDPLRLSLRALNREFQIVLTPDRSVFAEDVVFENSNGHRLEFDSDHVYTGTLEDDDKAVVSGVMTADGLFDGSISTQLEDYYIEPVGRYMSARNTAPTYHSIIYRASDVLRPKAACGRVHSGEPVDPNTTPFRSRVRRWNSPSHDYPTNSHIIVNSPNTVYHFDANRNASKLREEIVRDSLDSIRIIKVPGDVSIVVTRAKGNDSVVPRFSETEYNRPVDRSVYPNILVGNGPPEGNNDDTQHIHKRATVDPKKTTCMLYLQADHLFFQRYGTEEACIEVMTRHVQRVNSIYRITDFNQDGKADNISFMIKRIKVHSTEALQDPSYRFPGNYGVEKFLELFSEEDYDAFCLAYMFTYRDFEMGTLGLAWTGDLKNAGGVCEKNGHYRGSMKSLNTGIVTLLNYGRHVPPAVSHVTLAHEIGHNFGSPHDPEICTPGGEDGNFIMFARATSGDKKNNNQFSPCSLNSINPVLNAKARSPKGCFTEPQAAICGNGVVEEGEQCDCGWEDDCRDTCCFPQRRDPPHTEPPCHLTPNSLCSPSQGPCCTSECQLKFGDKCRDDNGCRDSSFCDGRGPYCPLSVNKPNKTVCNDEFVCFMGECTGSICLAYGLESCQCIPEPHEPATKACELCCKIAGEEHPCFSSFVWNSAPYDIPDMFSKPGTPCNDYNGYCDVFHKCREVDPSGPLATLRKLLLSEESIASFKKWLWDRWYYAALISSSVFLILVLSTRIFGKSTDLKQKTMTIIHSSTTEAVRLPGGAAEATVPGGGTAVVVHPVVVRSKLPLQRRSRPAQRKAHNKVIAKKKKLPKNKKKSKELIDYSGVKEKPPEKAPEEDPLGKVRNWLLNSHDIAGSLVVRKSKSSPAGFLQPGVTPRSPSKVHRLPEQRGSVDASSKEQIKLQVVYKPPFKFSVKLKKPTEMANVTNDIGSKSNRRNRDAILIQNYKKRKLNRTKQKLKPLTQQPCKEITPPKIQNVDRSAGATTNDKTKQDKEALKVKIGSEKIESPSATNALHNVEPVYQNTPIYQNLHDISSSKLGLLRTCSVSLANPSKESGSQKITRHHSVDGKCRESRSKNRQKDHKRYSLVTDKCTDSTAFPNLYSDSSPDTKASKRHSVPLLESDTDSNIHTMPSDMEVLLSESEYLFSDA